MTPEESQILQSTLDQIKKLIAAHSILVKPHLAAFDTTKRSHISTLQFSRALKQLNLLPDEKTFDILVRAYADNNTLHDVNYVVFCNDVDSKPEVNMGVPKVTPDYFTKPMVAKIEPAEFKEMNPLQPRFLKATVDVKYFML